MSRSALVVVIAAAVFIAGGSALAANRKAQQVVAGLEKEHAAMLSQTPALGQIDNEIRSDCAAKNDGKAATGTFCGCASAVTMGLWRSDIDPKMLPRLNEYLKNPTDAGAKAFLQYQGPELYRGICTEAGRR